MANNNTKQTPTTNKLKIIGKENQYLLVLTHLFQQPTNVGWLLTLCRLS